MQKIPSRVAIILNTQWALGNNIESIMGIGERATLLYKFELLAKTCGIAHLRNEVQVLQNRILNIHSEHSRKYFMEGVIKINP